MAHAKEKIIGTTDPLIEGTEYFRGLKNAQKKRAAEASVNFERAAFRSEMLPVAQKVKTEVAALEAEERYKLIELRNELESLFPPELPHPYHVEQAVLWIDQTLSHMTSAREHLGMIGERITRGDALHVIRDENWKLYEAAPDDIRGKIRDISNKVTEIKGLKVIKDLEAN